MLKHSQNCRDVHSPANPPDPESRSWRPVLDRWPHLPLDVSAHCVAVEVYLRCKSIIEANLLVSCACLPTLKHFVQCIAPNAFGSSRGQGTSGYTNQKSGAHKHGVDSSHLASKGRIGVSTTTSGHHDRPKPRRDNYHGFDGENDYRMETFVEGNADQGGPHRQRARDLEEGQLGVVMERNPSMTRSSGDGGGRDDDSAKAIIQTKTLQIHYEDRSQYGDEPPNRF